ncbi:alpha/beta hydrolase-fold protein [Adhaeribacter radiodurans]|uniref:Alpha/beta hydrolase n=1 Tax=Adhaeribacter radiodurans TaxID=2745197 RepID=A0A7L7L8D4_9BACT|nr:alpha/beta hydrolase-fold protein [Adhaeribacter radiodurans]QMU29086.1 alpha/beta hydrolase [Adhaeribacter radiodurans]
MNCRFFIFNQNNTPTFVFYFFTLLLTSFCVNAQENSPFTTGFEETISSKILSQQRKIWIHIPKSNGGNKVKDRGHYPVVYVLDGSENFNTVVSITEHLEESSLCPPMIVVGIVPIDRLSELTTGVDKDSPEIVGNNDKFMSFVEKELIPYIDTNYPTTTYKTLIGHSLGGLTVINTLLHHPDLFNAYVSLEASLWWNNRKLVEEAKTILPTQNYQGKTLFMAMANRMERGVDTLSVQKETSSSTKLIRSNLEFIKMLNRNRKNKLRYSYRFYKDDDHPSVRLVGEYDALRFVFDFYKLKIYDSELNNPNFRIDSVLETHYKKVSENMGYVVKPGESQVNRLGYQMLGTKQYKKAENLFKLNIANNPSSGNCYDSLGDLYLETGNKSKAIETFKKALTLQALPETKEKLNKLLNDPKKKV